MAKDKTKKENYPELKATFYRVYANVPINLRRDIIYADKEHHAMSWNVVWIEVENDTRVGRRALETLRNLKII